MDEKILEEMVLQLAAISGQMNKLTERVEKYVADLEEFAQRFEEVIENLETNGASTGRTT